MMANYSTPRSTCGLGYIYDFADDSDDGYDSDYADILKGTMGGTGFLTAGFISRNKLCTKVFRALKKKYKLVYRSPIRLNKNSGNKFYFAVFDCEGTDAKIGFDDFYERNRSYDDDDWGDD